MVFNLLKSKCTSVIGIDINCFTVKLIEISVHKGMYRVEGYAEELMPDNALEINVIKNSSVVANCIKRAVTKGNIKAKQAIVAVPDAAVITKIITIPAGLSCLEIEEFIRIDASQHVPYSSHEINVDFKVIGPSLNNVAMQDVQVFIARTDNVNARVNVVKQAGLVVKVVDIESIARQRSAQLLVNELSVGAKLTNEKLDNIVAFIDVGYVAIHLYVFHGMNVIFTRDEEFGGQLYFDSLNGVQPVMDILLAQIKRMMQFFFTTSKYKHINGIVFAGEVNRFAGFIYFMQEQMEVPICTVNPLNCLDVNKNINYQEVGEALPAMMLALGLALHRFN